MGDRRSSVRKIGVQFEKIYYDSRGFMFSQEEKNWFIGLLTSKRVSAKCPMCQNSNFVIADAYIRNELQENLNSVNLGGPAIPTVAIICSNCGFISQHAIGMLGLLPGAKEEKNV